MDSGRFKSPWISISDMMTGLMMIFLFISVSYSYQINEKSKDVTEKQENIADIVQEWKDYKKVIADDLHKEFDKDLKKWDASIDDDNLSFRFESPEVLFKAGKSQVTPLFDEILSDFWPRYISVLNRHDYYIREIKIEGHTSSEWSSSVTREESYFLNMQLSQDRSRNVLHACYSNTSKIFKEWIISSITANGFSFSRLMYDEEGNEDIDKSRRVEFTIMVDSETKINEISDKL